MAAENGGGQTDRGKRQAEERLKRRAEALRANLHRRKAQSRARQDDDATVGDATVGDAAVGDAGDQSESAAD